MVYLSGVGDELHAVVGERNAAAAAVKDRDAKLFFQLLHRAGQGRLRDVENLGGLIERPGFGYGDRVMKLLQCHLDPSPVLYRRIGGAGLFFQYSKFSLACQETARRENFIVSA